MSNGLLDWCTKLTFRLIGTTLWVALVAPWVTLAILRICILNSGLVLRVLRQLRPVFATHLHCPSHHRSALHGVFECRACGSLFGGWAFQRCPICGDVSVGYVACEHCGMAVKNPFL